MPSALSRHTRWTKQTQGDGLEPTRTKTVTLDTNVLAPSEVAEIERAAQGLQFDLAYTTVSARELEGFTDSHGRPITMSGAPLIESGVYGESRYGQAVYGGPAPLLETAVVGEGRVGYAVVGSDDGAGRLEQLLKIVSGGTFPGQGKRESLSAGQKRQLRDAMILDTHLRESRDIFVTRDAKGFIRQGRREAIESLYGARIMDADEFAAYCHKLRSAQSESS